MKRIYPKDSTHPWWFQNTTVVHRMGRGQNLYKDEWLGDVHYTAECLTTDDILLYELTHAEFCMLQMVENLEGFLPQEEKKE